MPGVRYIAVTGTNGKSTTTALVGHLLGHAGYRAIAAGNIGMPLCEVAIAPILPRVARDRALLRSSSMTCRPWSPRSPAS